MDFSPLLAVFRLGDRLLWVVSGHPLVSQACLNSTAPTFPTLSHTATASSRTFRRSRYPGAPDLRRQDIQRQGIGFDLAGQPDAGYARVPLRRRKASFFEHHLRVSNVTFDETQPFLETADALAYTDSNPELLEFLGAGKGIRQRAAQPRDEPERKAYLDGIRHAIAERSELIGLEG